MLFFSLSLCITQLIIESSAKMVVIIWISLACRRLILWWCHCDIYMDGSHSSVHNNPSSKNDPWKIKDVCMLDFWKNESPQLEHSKAKTNKQTSKQTQKTVHELRKKSRQYGFTFKVLFFMLQFDYSISTSIKSLTTTALRATFFDFSSFL